MGKAGRPYPVGTNVKLKRRDGGVLYIVEGFYLMSLLFLSLSSGLSWL